MPLLKAQDIELAKLLVEAGADINTKNVEGKTLTFTLFEELIRDHRFNLESVRANRSASLKVWIEFAISCGGDINMQVVDGSMFEWKRIMEVGLLSI